MDRVTLPTGIELDVLDVGPRDAPVLIFLHGFPESHRTWRHQIVHLSTRFRCVAPDQRGYGGSSKPQDPASYTPDKLVADVFHLADALGIDRFTIAGHDWGGAIAWLVAILGQHARVDRAIIANAPHPTLFQRLQWTDPVQRAASQYIRLFRDTSLDPAIREHGLMAVLARAFPPETAGQLLDPDEAPAMLARFADPASAITMLNWYRASPIEVPPMEVPFGMEGRSLVPLPALTIPSLVIWGEDDIALPPANLNGLADHVADLVLRRVPGCGHFITWQAPAEVNATIDAFLDPAES